jgi:hypothetical protein
MQLLLDAGARANLRGAAAYSVHIAQKNTSSTPLRIAVTREHLLLMETLLE